MASREPAPEDVEVDGVAGRPIALPIAAGPATGYRWYLELPGGVERIDDEPGQPPDQAHRLGGSESGRLRVVAAAGDHLVVASLARPWERPAAIRVVRIHLRVR